MPRTDNRAVLAMIFSLALALRLWGFDQPRYFIVDEVMFMPAAKNFVSSGLYEPSGWFQPPLSFYVTEIGQKLFGNNPYGWRMLNVLFGSASVLLLVLLAQRLFADRRIGWLAGVLYAVEPFHIQLSRTNFMEIVPVFFFLLFVYAIVSYMRGTAWALAAAGIPLGLAIGGKWYFILPALGAAIFTGIEILKKKEDRLVRFPLLLSMAPAALGVYLLLFLPWFRRGGGLDDFFVWQYDAYRLLQSIKIEDYLNSYFRAFPSVPWDWFLKPVIVAAPMHMSGAWGAYFVIMSNFPVWLLVLPGFFYLCVQAWKYREKHLALVLLLFAASYFQFVMVERPVFLYSSVVVLPFAYLLVARALAGLTGGSPRGNHVFAGILSASLLWGLYLYPLITSRTVPLFLYQYLLPAAH